MRVGGLLGVLVLVGCGGPIPLEKYCAENARADCERAQRCGAITRSVDCTTRPPDFDCLDFYRQGLAAGSITYDPAAAGKCVQEIRSADCLSADFRNTSWCTRVFGGSVLGGSCGVCGPDLICLGFASGRCGTCVEAPAPPSRPKAALGEPCDPPELLGAGCLDANAACRRVLEPTFRCVALVPPGGRCGLSIPCERGSFCRSEGAELVCGALAELGERCDPIPCKGWLRCSDGHCAAQSKNGQRCVSGEDCASTICREGACAPSAGEGEPCENQCRRDLRCDGAICVRPRAVGEACVGSFPSECAGFGRCVSGVCRDDLVDCH